MIDVSAYYSQLFGSKITGFRLEPDDYGDDPWPTFVLVTADGTTLEMCLSRDPEGNGGGFAFIAPPASAEGQR
ncbi:hypothetical protein EU803_15640 [Loktanella sp. IMCC34160]|uniref:hypothetical protein n=1 Tax=Loktanella sp. IMCC34160 TaxID=2510646 RepID=UPI00101C0975|nr:hypothetical protein [Loktanella sp. IMCC34160]RYG90046.1 hypothetical protein EU803_15640 [Loktanella sp. IMCC34160]